MSGTNFTKLLMYLYQAIGNIAEASSTIWSTADMF